MRVLVLGGGVIGVTTAWFLARDGHDVAVIDRQPEVANETSFANAGLVSPGHAFSWASPSAPWTLLKSLFRDDTGLQLRLRADPRLLAWGLAFLGQCTAARFRINTLRKFRLCAYSQSMLDGLVEETGLDYDRSKNGILYLHRSVAALEQAVASMRLLADQGVRVETLDRAGCVRIEPAFGAVKDDIAGAVYCADDESGDCRRFTLALAERCRQAGVDFVMETRIERIEAAGDEIEAVVTDKGATHADAYVLAAGPGSPFLARAVGIRLPIYPVRGYSLTVPIAGRNGAPRVPGVDEGRYMAWSRLGDRLRLTATAEFDGYDLTPTRHRFASMRQAAARLFPDGGDYDRATEWVGLRPVTPTGVPILGRLRHRNLWFNTGHGSMGWTMSCGSARITADLIAGRHPAIDLAEHLKVGEA